MINHKLLCLFEGKCWHEFETVPYQVPSGFRGTSTKCKHCNKTYIQLKNYVYPDYSSPNTYLPFLQWFWKEKREVWEAFGGWQWERWFDTDKRPFTIQSNYIWLFSLTDEGEPRVMVLLSEWLSLPEVIEKWGWEECPYRKEWPRTAKDGGSSFFCEKECKQEPPPCNGTGRIKAEWAKDTKE